MSHKLHFGRKRKRATQHLPPPGSSPGIITVDPEAPPPKLQALSYSADECVWKEIETLEEVEALRGKRKVLWVNVDGLGDAKVIERLGEIFGLHKLALEDVVHLHQRAKVDHYDGHQFIILPMPRCDPRFEVEQLSMFQGEDFVLTFQYLPGDCLGRVRDRITKKIGQIRMKGASYLAYAIVDACIDAFFPVLEDYGERLEKFEDEILEGATRHGISHLHEIKRDLLIMRRMAWPLREAVAALMHDDSDFVDSDVRIYLRDCHDHALRIMDTVDTYRETCSDLLDVFLTMISNKTNEIMKVLTIISTIFIPLSFIAGVYGMNFDPHVSPYNMPELEWRWGYPFSLAIMAAIAGYLLLFFYRRGWLDFVGDPEMDRGRRRHQRNAPACEAPAAAENQEGRTGPPGRMH